MHTITLLHELVFLLNSDRSQPNWGRDAASAAILRRQWEENCVFDLVQGWPLHIIYHNTEHTISPGAGYLSRHTNICVRESGIGPLQYAPVESWPVKQLQLRVNL